MTDPVSSATILCIDDTMTVRLLVSRLLETAGYQVLEAKCGLEGIEVAKQAEPDLVLVDLHMPDLTGYEVATRLKSFLPKVPVVALTADVSQHVRERVLASGCDGYISKPLDPDSFFIQVEAFLAGARERLGERQEEAYREAYQQTLVARLEEKVRELTEALEKNAELNVQNVHLLEKAQRRARLLEAGAKVGRNITSILNLDQLLSVTVDAICDEFGFYYAGVFMVEKEESGGLWAILRAGYGQAGQAMIDEGYRLKVGGDSMVGVAAVQRRALIALDVGAEPVHFKNPHLPDTRSEMALPLVAGGDVIGVLTVQSVEEAAFDEEDSALLQIMADQLAIAVDNARLLADLEHAHQELVRTKTYEAIANATGEAIHWVGNKAAPIPGSVTRVKEDVIRFLAIMDTLFDDLPQDLEQQPFARFLRATMEDLAALGVSLPDVQANLTGKSFERLRKMLDVHSIFEDLEIIVGSARSILNIKEDMIGPARQRKLESIDIAGLLTKTVAAMGISSDVARTLFAEDLQPVWADRVQMERVFANLIKNALEAMDNVAEKRLFIWARMADEPGLVVVEVTDNGVGIAPDQMDKIWMAFYTTKGDRGGTGLGLPACVQIVGQLGGKILVDSEVGLGTTFSVYLPVAKY